MKKVIAGSAVCLALLAGAIRGQTATTAPVTPATHPDDLDAATLKDINDMRTALVDALNHRDYDKVLTYLDKDIVVTWSNAEVSHGPAEVKAYCERMTNGPDKIVETVTANPVVEGRKLYGPDVLISYGTLGDAYKLTDGRSFTLNSRFSSLLVRQDGKWKMKGFHASANVFNNPIQDIVARQVGMWVGIGAGAGGLIVGFLLAKLFRRKPRATV